MCDSCCIRGPSRTAPEGEVWCSPPRLVQDQTRIQSALAPRLRDCASTVGPRTLARVKTLDVRAVCFGALAAVVIALPLGLAGQIVVGDDGTDNSLLSLVFLLPILLAFMVGGFIAGRRAAAAPLTNGALAALGAFALIQGVGLVRRVVTGGTISWTSLAFAAFLAYSCGLVGAGVAQRLRAGTGSRTGDTEADRAS